MPKTFHKVVYKPSVESSELFQVIVNGEEYKKWKGGDTTIPLADVVDAFQVFSTGAGTQGIMGKPSKQQVSGETRKARGERRVGRRERGRQGHRQHD
jgi:hypothetical protein